MQNAVAFSNNDVITVAWSYGKKPTGCMGFAVYRIDDKGREEVLPSHAVFKGESIKPGQTTADFPIQKFYWKDVYARLVAEKTGNRTFRYKIVPLEGTPGKFAPMAHLPLLTTNEVTIGPDISDNIKAYFNRGLISTQRIATALGKTNKKQTLLTRIANKDDALRASLSGDMVEALTGFVDRAKTGGRIYAALYELKDQELIEKLTGLGKRLSIVLSNAKEVKDDKTGDVVPQDDDDEVPKKKKQIVTDGNQAARDALTQTTDEKYDRIMPNGHIGHNKFLVYVDAKKKPRAVLFGSTNWTNTGLCTQTNNTLVIEDDALAKRYLGYWKTLSDDTKNANGDPKLLQGSELRSSDAKGKKLKIGDDTLLESWFSPNTPKARSSNKSKEATPPDMESLRDLMLGAKQCILFLAFYPGSPCVADWAAQAAVADKKRSLFIRGAVTHKSAQNQFYYGLRGMTPPPTPKGQKPKYMADPRVIGAVAFDKIVPDGWKQEILNAGIAIIHDKIVVIDPFSDDCVVATGSHNLGHKASYDNDENLAIIHGNKKLAMAYATHVLDVYDHFSSRFWAGRDGAKPDDFNLKSTPDEWLAKYFDAKGSIVNAQLNFWMQAAATP